MSRRVVSFPTDTWPPRMSAAIPSSDDMFANEAVWIAAGTGGAWPNAPATQIYFLQGETSGLIRFGIAKDIKARVASHRSSSAETLKWLGDMPGGLPLERLLHSTFKACRVKGSWYRPEQELLDTIARMVVL